MFTDMATLRTKRQIVNIELFQRKRRTIKLIKINSRSRVVVLNAKNIFYLFYQWLSNYCCIQSVISDCRWNYIGSISSVTRSRRTMVFQWWLPTWTQLAPLKWPKYLERFEHYIMTLSNIWPLMPYIHLDNSAHDY